jgi:nicotinamide-nucleotide amidase
MKKTMKIDRAEVLNVGSELLYDRVNTDINIITGLLYARGIKVSRSVTVADNKEEIIAAARESLARSSLLIVTGGLGPTFDDLTREAIAELLDEKLVFSQSIWREIKARFKKRGISLPEANKKQAYVLERAVVLKNTVGTAPGQAVEKGGKVIVILPGPPDELRPMLQTYLPVLTKGITRQGKVYRFGIVGLSESFVEEKIKKILPKFNFDFTILASPSLIEIIAVSDLNCGKEIAKLDEKFRELFTVNYLGIDPPTLPAFIKNILCEKNLKLALAESCTGGFASKLITDIPGSSACFQGSFVTYSNVLKKRILKVPRSVLKKNGAVSKEVALFMARGAIKEGKADVSISFTGIAGPSGGTSDKPVGTVWIGIGLPYNRGYARKFFFPGTRDRIRQRSVYQGFNLLRQSLLTYEKWGKKTK